MNEQIPQDIVAVYQKIVSSGYEVYLVGGSVRNMLLNKEVKDWDFTTNATPEEILKLFPEAFYDNEFGTVGIPIKIPSLVSLSPRERSSGVRGTESSRDNQTIIEITTFRSESEYKDRRHPEKVTWGKTIQEDLERRDFTINAMALSLPGHPELDSGSIDVKNIVDPYDGQKDLQDKIIRAVGNPTQRFEEDALRLMRAVRFATQLGFTIEEQTLSAIVKNANLITEIAWERIRDELLKILESAHAYEGIMLLKNAGLLQFILPELLEGIGISQVRPGRHHTEDVFTHNMLSLKYSPSKNPVVKLATLLHDVGKPRVKGEDQQGLVTFYNHEVIGAKIANDISDRLRLSKHDKEKIYLLIRWHMFSVEDIMTDAAIRRFIRRVGSENIKDMVDVRTADRLGSGAKEDSWRFEKFRERVEKELLPPPFSINDLAIDGNDIMKELGIKPGPKVGQILQKLFEEVDEDMEKNTKEYLLKKIHEF